MIDFALPADLVDLQQRTREFIARDIVPLETDPRAEGGHVSDELRRELNTRARAAGLLAPQTAREWGGLGLGHVARAVVFEEAGYSPLGPIAMHLAAPDEGNMHMLEEVASEEQKRRWLAPLAAADIRRPARSRSDAGWRPWRRPTSAPRS